MSPAERVGLSPARLANIEKMLREKYVDRGRASGYLVQVWRRGELACNVSIGLMDVERNKPMREDAIFRIKSMSKPITAVAIMTLVEEGRIGLGDDVADYIPSWTDLEVFAGGNRGAFRIKPVTRSMKIIDLLTHTAGLTYGSPTGTPVATAYTDAGVLSPQTPGGLAGMVEQLADIPLEFSPGEKWNYSVAIDVLGYIVEKVSGERFGDFLLRRLFAPLGMNDTAFFCPPEKIDRLSSCYEVGPDGRLRLFDDAGDGTYAQPPLLESGGGGLLSTAGDYMRFCRMMLGGGELDGARILSPKTVALFSVNYLPGNREILDMSLANDTFSEAGYAGVGMSLACGVSMDLAKMRIPGTPGEFFWGGSMATAFWIDPKEEMAVVLMSQVANSPYRIAVRRDIRTLVYSALTASFA